MLRSSSFIPYQPGARQSQTVKGAVDFLRIHDKMASILPTATRMAALQKDCAAILSSMFNTCTVLSFESGQLVLAVPNAAIASKLKQQLPKLQDSLRQCGWQVSAIRLKVQVIQEIAKKETVKQLKLPSHALSALATLGNALEDSPRNAALKATLNAMLQHHRAGS
ncbi:MAG: DciA family protein [Burkholderiales bacterium]